MRLWSLLFGPAREDPPATLPPSGSAIASPSESVAVAAGATAEAAAPAMSAAGLALVKRFEGLRLKPYRDAAGHPTIGYGHLIRPDERREQGIDAAQADALLAADLRMAEAAVARLVTVPLARGQRDALVSFVFNLGAARLADSTLLKKLNAGDGLGACQEFVRWIHAGGRPLKGLLRRRLAEATLFLED